MTLPASAPGPCTWPDWSLQSSKLALSLPSLGLCGFRIQSKLLSWSVSSHLLPSAQRNLPVRPASAQPHSAPSRPGLASAVLSAWSAFPAQPVPVTLCGSALLASGNPLSPLLPTHTPASAYGDTPLLCFPQSPRVSPHQGIPAVEEVTTRAHTRLQGSHSSWPLLPGRPQAGRSDTRECSRIQMKVKKVDCRCRSPKEPVRKGREGAAGEETPLCARAASRTWRVIFVTAPKDSRSPSLTQSRCLSAHLARPLPSAVVGMGLVALPRSGPVQSCAVRVVGA